MSLSEARSPTAPAAHAQTLAQVDRRCSAVTTLSHNPASLIFVKEPDKCDRECIVRRHHSTTPVNIEREISKSSTMIVTIFLGSRIFHTFVAAVLLESLLCHLKKVVSNKFASGVIIMSEEAEEIESPAGDVFRFRDACKCLLDSLCDSYRVCDVIKAT